MGFFDFVKRKTGTQDNWKKTLVKDLVMLTAVDGKMEQEEIELVFDIATNELGFSKLEFTYLMNNLANVKDIYPSDESKKFEYMLSLIRVTYSDGNIDNNEMAYMEIVAEKMGLPYGGVQKAMSIIENKFLNDIKINATKNQQENLSIEKIIITSPIEPTVDVQSMNGINKYLEKISKLEIVELSIEFSNVLAAKHNKMLMPLGLNTYSEDQKIITDLTDKALLISFIAFGQEKVLNYCNQDTRIFNQLVNDIDENVAIMELTPAAHGKKMFDEIHQIISR